MKKIILLSLALAYLPGAKAQSIGPATLNIIGGSDIIGANVFDWSIGEMVLVSTFSAGSVIVTQGVLQPSNDNSSAVMTSELQKQLQVFPNPASAAVNIHYTSETSGTLSYRLMDMTGKSIVTDAIQLSAKPVTAQVDLSGIAVATYMLEISVTSDLGTSKTSYKIEKLQ